MEEAHALGKNLTVWIFTAREMLGEEGRKKENLIEYVISEIYDMFTN